MAKILFFSPNSVIHQFSYTEALVGESLKLNGNEVIQISCGKAFSDYCISMKMKGVEINSTRDQKKAICASCVENKNRIRNSFGISGNDLVDYIDSEIIFKINQILASITKNSFLNLVVNDIQVGRIALYELLIINKKITFELNDDEWNFYLIALKNCLKTLFAADRILKEEQPDSIVVYSSEYSVNHTFCLVAKLKGIQFYTMDSGGNLCTKNSTIFLAKSYASTYRSELKKHWIDFKKIPTSRSTIELITCHFLELLKGIHPWAYSPKKNENEISIRSYFGITKKQKIVTATMSSYDEKFAVATIRTDLTNENPLFNTQLEWVKFLISFFEKRSELFLIIRVHPREFPNKFETITSEHARLLQSSFSILPKNVKINWPQDNISLYDIASETDVFLNSWSSVGKEMSFLGIPVVSYSHNLLTNYHSDLNYLGETEESYIFQIDKALIDGWSYENIRNTIRWYALEHKYSLFDISESYPEKTRKVSFLSKVFRKGIRTLVPEIQAYFIKKDELYIEKRRVPLKDNKHISELIVLNKNTILDLNLIESLPVTNPIEEQVAIRDCMIKILNILAPKNKIEINEDKILYNNLLSFVEKS